MKTMLRKTKTQVDPAGVRTRQRQFVQLAEQKPILGIMLAGLALARIPIFGHRLRHELCQLGWLSDCGEDAKMQSTDVELLRNCVEGLGLGMQLMDAIDGTPLLQTEMRQMRDGRFVNRLLVDQIFDSLEELNRQVPGAMPELVRLQRGASSVFPSLEEALHDCGLIEFDRRTRLQPIAESNVGMLFAMMQAEVTVINPIVSAVLKNALPKGYKGEGFVALQSVYADRIPEGTFDASSQNGHANGAKGAKRPGKRERRRRREQHAS